jgi:hypothetical protein
MRGEGQRPDSQQQDAAAPGCGEAGALRAPGTATHPAIVAFGVTR